MPLHEGEFIRPKQERKTSPTCGQCGHYWPTVYGRKCLAPLQWGGEMESIEDIECGSCGSFVYRSTRIGCSDE